MIPALVILITVPCVAHLGCNNIIQLSVCEKPLQGFWVWRQIYLLSAR